MWYHILRRTGPPSHAARLWTFGQDAQAKNPDLAARASIVQSADGKASGNRPEARAHQADAVEIGLFTGVLLGALARLVALVQEFDFLQLLESLA